MKQIIYSSINLLFLSLFLCSFTFTENTGIHSTDRTNEKIELQRDGSTRPGFVFNVEAYKNGMSIDLFVENFTGPVEIFIQQSPIYHIVEINETGYVTIDISQLPGGRTYTLRIIIDNKEYVGVFER